MKLDIIIKNGSTERDASDKPEILVIEDCQFADPDTDEDLKQHRHKENSSKTDLNSIGPNVNVKKHIYSNFARTNFNSTGIRIEQGETIQVVRDNLVRRESIDDILNFLNFS